MTAETAGTRPQARTAYLFLVLTTLMWGGNAVAGQLVVGHASPMAVTTLRWLIVCTLLLVLARGRLLTDWPALKPHLGRIVAMGILGYTGFNSLFYLAAHYTGGVNVSILQGSIPAFVFVVAYFMNGTPIRPAQAIGVVISILGVALVASKGSLATLLGLAFNVGDLLMLIACVFYGTYTAALRNRPKASDIGFFTVMAIAAFVTSLPLAAAEYLHGSFSMPTPWGWVVVLWIGIFPSLLSQLTYMRGVSLIGPGRAGVFANLVPIFGAALSVGLLGEPFGWYHAVGMALVVGGIAWAQRA